ncbi:hypothetical protein Ae201684P_004139 [Aphanomyces euteiches]|uniref:ubiquitinyl hydrolase 1 n=1 Tax=Aphanomyces euteiches TaxID=100861 RepID=A0A6G0XTS1_9STRA|nr:hypothetical protein Ae201684_001468 [Aphanomyces euteiches]KAH9075459.1 hypothetical protein Ae201684P_004139 [Aphanomyces euteiches]
MGNGGISGISRQELHGFPPDEKFFGLENFGNTCYCNSILQVLYFCAPFRAHLIEYYQSKGLQKKKLDLKDRTLLDCMAELFHKISQQKKTTGYVTPKSFVAKLQSENEMFRGPMHQDAHEFLNYVLNQICDLVEAEHKKDSSSSPPSSPTSPSSSSRSPFKTWVHEIFEGVLTNETKCLECNTVTHRDEAFLDLSIEIEPNTSLFYCLKKFGITETLAGDEKFFCDKCRSLQNAEKRMHLKRIPHVLALHLKRFKYMEKTQSFAKLFHRIVFSAELKLPTLITECASIDSTKLYELFAVVIHIGNGMDYGHYVCLIQCHDQWLLFDDESVQLVQEDILEHCFGYEKDESPSNTATGYLVFYRLIE